MAFEHSTDCELLINEQHDALKRLVTFIEGRKLAMIARLSPLEKQRFEADLANAKLAIDRVDLL
jgi:hypothetical protein